MSFIALNSENKQHINLSNHAINVLINDMSAFQVENKSTFINRIIENFSLIADSTISLSSEKYYSEISEKLQNYDQKYISDICGTLTNCFISETINRYSKLPKDNAFKIRINKTNYDYLFIDCLEDQYYSNSGEYIKSLIEEYTQKDFVDREQIFASDYFRLIENAITSEKTLSIRLTNGKALKVRPYKIVTDSLSMYHYLVGISILTNEKNETIKNLFSCRISNLEKIRMLQEHSFISKQEKNTLESAIRNKGVQFLYEDIDEFKIYLTDQGIDMYNRILHLRPSFSSIECDKHTYNFICSYRQIEFYFLKFGAEAIILSPVQKKEQFHQFYQNALQAYK